MILKSKYYVCRECKSHIIYHRFFKCCYCSSCKKFRKVKASHPKDNDIITHLENFSNRPIDYKKDYYL